MDRQENELPTNDDTVPVLRAELTEPLILMSSLLALAKPIDVGAISRMVQFPSNDTLASFGAAAAAASEFSRAKLGAVVSLLQSEMDARARITERMSGIWSSGAGLARQQSEARYARSLHGTTLGEEMARMGRLKLGAAAREAAARMSEQPGGMRTSDTEKRTRAHVLGGNDRPHMGACESASREMEARFSQAEHFGRTLSSEREIAFPEAEPGPRNNELPTGSLRHFFERFSLPDFDPGQTPPLCDIGTIQVSQEDRRRLEECARSGRGWKLVLAEIFSFDLSESQNRKPGPKLKSDHLEQRILQLRKDGIPVKQIQGIIKADDDFKRHPERLEVEKVIRRLNKRAARERRDNPPS